MMQATRTSKAQGKADWQGALLFAFAERNTLLGTPWSQMIPNLLQDKQVSFHGSFWVIKGRGPHSKNHCREKEREHSRMIQFPDFERRAGEY